MKPEKTETIIDPEEWVTEDGGWYYYAGALGVWGPYPTKEMAMDLFRERFEDTKAWNGWGDDVVLKERHETRD